MYLFAVANAAFLRHTHYVNSKVFQNDKIETSEMIKYLYIQYIKNMPSSPYSFTWMVPLYFKLRLY